LIERYGPDANMVALRLDSPPTARRSPPARSWTCAACTIPTGSV